MDIEVREVAEPQLAYRLAARIPEFDPGGGGLDAAEFERRLGRPGGLLLVAYAGAEIVGFKAGYDRYLDGSFYSWMGGVLPAGRGRGIATLLLQEQERRVAAARYERIYVKTRNRHRAMLRLLIGAGYDLVGIDSRDDPGENRLLLCKLLTAPPPR